MSTSTTVPQRASRAQRQSNAVARAESLIMLDMEITKSDAPGWFPSAPPILERT